MERLPPSGHFEQLIRQGCAMVQRMQSARPIQSTRLKSRLIWLDWQFLQGAKLGIKCTVCARLLLEYHSGA